MMSNMSNREHFRLHGSLPTSAIEALIDTQERADEQADLTAHLSEARAQYPKEDFLEKVIDRLRDLTKTTRGDNREEIESLMQVVEDIQLEVSRDADYGRDELDKAEKGLDEAS